MIGLVVLAVIFGAGIFANFIAPYSFEEIDLTNVLQAPTTVGHHFFGTDEIGRDYLSRVIYGIRTSLEVGVFVGVVATFIGVVVGAISGYYGGVTDNIPMRITDLVLTLPALAILLTAAALLGQGSQWRVDHPRASSSDDARAHRARYLPGYARRSTARGRQGGRVGRLYGSCSATSLPNTLGPGSW
jgi:ABC-type dipeptide/oligopeptide/nickel transport system permease subunit